jgi:hypothetical protein
MVWRCDNSQRRLASGTVRPAGAPIAAMPAPHARTGLQAVSCQRQCHACPGGCAHLLVVHLTERGRHLHLDLGLCVPHGHNTVKQVPSGPGNDAHTLAAGSGPGAHAVCVAQQEAGRSSGQGVGLGRGGAGQGGEEEEEGGGCEWEGKRAPAGLTSAEHCLPRRCPAWPCHKGSIRCARAGVLHAQAAGCSSAAAHFPPPHTNQFRRHSRTWCASCRCQFARKRTPSRSICKTRARKACSDRCATARRGQGTAGRQTFLRLALRTGAPCPTHVHSPNRQAPREPHARMCSSMHPELWRISNKRTRRRTLAGPGPAAQ